jgi:hypothetical protein
VGQTWYPYGGEYANNIIKNTQRCPLVRVTFVFPNNLHDFLTLFLHLAISTTCVQKLVQEGDAMKGDLPANLNSAGGKGDAAQLPVVSLEDYNKQCGSTLKSKVSSAFSSFGSNPLMNGVIVALPFVLLAIL